MASTSGCLHQLKDLQLSDTPCTMCDSNMSEFATTTLVSEADHTTPLTSYFSTLEKQSKRSKAYSNTPSNEVGCMDEEGVDFEVSNKQEFQALQWHPTWGSFFANFSGDGMSTGFNHDDLGELVVGKKFAEGGQIELYEAQIKWNDPKNVETDLRLKHEYMLKVFKEGTLLKHVISQLPQGLLQFHVKSMENGMSPTPKLLPDYTCRVHCGILLKNGRFAFLMQNQHFDLRVLIEHNMKLRSNEDCGPFSKEEAEVLMYQVALGVEWLHNHDIVHRDLKTSNVLVQENKSGWPKWTCYVANYECSIGVIGTHFFRAPEILQVCKERKANERPEVFSRAVDAYSYGMTCYEILTGKLLFEDHPLRGRPSLLIDLVVNQHIRPEVPKYVDDWTRELLDACWEADPTSRPTIGEILDVLSTNSTGAKRFEDVLKERFGENFRS